MRWVVSLVVLTAASLAVGFIWLPSVQADFTAQGVWDSICRAAGVPAKWSSSDEIKAGPSSTHVVLTPAMARVGGSEAIGHGATLALQRCTMCHGAHGESVANAPNLAGQYSEVVMKQLLDFRGGDRASAVMQALAAGLDEAQVRDLASYYASLPRPKNTPVADISTAPALVRVGDPMRNVAPCAACHGGIDRKLGAPWMEGMPKDYLVQQLRDFASGARRNDSHAQMRNVARALTDKDIEDVADFYARHDGR